MCWPFWHHRFARATQLILNSLRRLEYRGYDSAGITILVNSPSDDRGFTLLGVLVALVITLLGLPTMKHKAAGFALLELLVVIVVTGMILVLLGQGLRLGLLCTDSYVRAVQSQTGMEPVDRALRNMIEHIDLSIHPGSPMLRSTPSALAFTTELHNPATGGTRTTDVRLEIDAGRLVLWWTPHTFGKPFAGPPPPHMEVLQDGVARLQISYAAKDAPGAWLSSWHRPGLPGLVRLDMQSANGAKAWPPIIVGPPREQAER